MNETLDEEVDFGSFESNANPSIHSDYAWPQGTTGIIAAGMLVPRGLRFYFRLRVRAVQSQDLGRDLGGARLLQWHSPLAGPLGYRHGISGSLML